MQEQEKKIQKIEKEVSNESFKIKDMVEYILHEYPSTRESDVSLFLKIGEEFYGFKDHKITYEQFESFPLKAIERCRRKLNEEGKYLPENESILKKRRLLEKAYKKVYKK